MDKYLDLLGKVTAIQEELTISKERERGFKEELEGQRKLYKESHDLLKQMEEAVINYEKRHREEISDLKSQLSKTEGLVKEAWDAGEKYGVHKYDPDYLFPEFETWLKEKGITYSRHQENDHYLKKVKKV